jgi:HYR domain
MKAWNPVLAVLAAVVVGLHVGAATAMPTQRLHAVFHVSWKAVPCPKGTPTTTGCYLNVGRTVVPGLGAATERYVLLVEHTDTTCADWRFTAVLTVAGRGSIRAGALRPGCFSPLSQNGISRYRITGGSGAYRGASGSGKIASTGTETGPAQGTGTDTWTGTLAVSGRRLDSAGSGDRAAGTLQLHGVFSARWSGADCPAGSPTFAVCYATVGRGRVPGLGEVTETYIAVVDDQAATCVYPHFVAVLTVAGKGEIGVSARSPDCVPPLQPSGSVDYVVTGGSGAYAGASGSGRQTSAAHETGYAQGIAVDTWDGSLAVTGLEFDTAAPHFQPVRNIVVKAPHAAKRALVRYTTTAEDDVDGAVPVSCRPRSNSRFKLGTTKVACSAVDRSGNTARAAFTVTVRRV